MIAEIIISLNITVILVCLFVIYVFSKSEEKTKKGIADYLNRLDEKYFR